MSRHHNPGLADCHCYYCGDARYHEAAAAIEEEDRLIRARLAAEAEAEAEAASRQLRLPIPGLPHVAHLPSHI
jgi:hypothetical protein